MPCRFRQRCNDDRVRCGIVACSAYRQSSSGSNVCRRKAMMIASSSTDSTVEAGCCGPVGRSTTELRFFHLATVDPVSFGQSPQALLTTLYRSTDRLCRGGAAVKNLAQSASLHAGENNAPSKPGTKQLGHEPIKTLTW